MLLYRQIHQISILTLPPIVRTSFYAAFQTIVCLFPTLPIITRPYPRRIRAHPRLIHSFVHNVKRLPHLT